MGRAAGRVMRILVLYWHRGPGEMRLAVQQHLHALDAAPGDHRIRYCNAVDGVPARLKYAEYDAIVLHTTLLRLRWHEQFYLLKWRLRWLNGRECVKVALPQDEYDHSEILDEWLYELGVNVIFTTFGERWRSVLYPIMSDRAAFHRCLTGYIDAETARACQARLIAPERRPVDIVYRATRLPYWFGGHGQLKHRVGEVVEQRARRHGLTVDISTSVDDTIVGRRWLEFLQSGRAVIGCESGSSVLDRRGAVRSQVRNLCAERPSLSFEEVGRRMPSGWDDYRFVAVSPRHFEAVITKTCQILVEGHYDGVLKPGAHYLPIKHDFSNVEEVLDQIKDHRLLGRIADRAYEEIHLSQRYTYRRFGEQIREAIVAAQALSGTAARRPRRLVAEGQPR